MAGHMTALVVHIDWLAAFWTEPRLEVEKKIWLYSSNHSSIFSKAIILIFYSSSVFHSWLMSYKNKLLSYFFFVVFL